MNDSCEPQRESEIKQITKVVLVGHCGFDQGSLGRAVASALPGLVVEAVHNTAGLQRHGGPEALLLINRVLDGRFGTGSGVDLIRELSSGEDTASMMLISNYPDAQAHAVQAGAMPGFGKNEMGLPGTVQKLQAAVGVAQSQA